MNAPVGVQRRFMLLGRVRLGEKGAKGEPRKLKTFRLTTANRALLEAAAGVWGGTVQEWKGAPDDGYYELTTEASELAIIIPPVFSAEDGSPTVPYSQFYELWSGGGCQRRCDGQTESLSGKPCLCDPEARECKITTRVNFMLPDIPGLGVWRLDSHGWNAAAELPGTLELLQRAAAERQFIDAVLRAEERSRKQDGKTIRYIVPVIDLPGLRVGELVPPEQRMAIGMATTGEITYENAPTNIVVNAPALRPPKPELPTTEPDTAGQPFENERLPEWGEAVPIEPAAPSLDDQIARTREELLVLLSAIGPTEVAVAAIETNAAKNADEPSKHLTWLRGQKTRAENAVTKEEE